MCKHNPNSVLANPTPKAGPPTTMGPGGPATTTAATTTKPPATTAARYCNEKKCRGPNADGGYSCWGVDGDSGHFKCADNLKVVMTGEQDDYDHEGTVLLDAATLL